MGENKTVRIVALVLGIAAAAVLGWRLMQMFGSQSVGDRAAAMVTFKCEVTGEEWEIEWSQVENMMFDRYNSGRPLDPSKGIPSPSNGGELTGYPVDGRFRDSLRGLITDLSKMR